MTDDLNERTRKIFRTLGGKFKTDAELEEFANRCAEKLTEIIIENGKEQKEKDK